MMYKFIVFGLLKYADEMKGHSTGIVSVLLCYCLLINRFWSFMIKQIKEYLISFLVLTYFCLRIPLEIIFWICVPFDNNLEIKNYLTNY